MRLVVDLTRCQGYAQCAFAAPDVFRMHGDEALWYDPEPGDLQREQVLAAAAACPVQALRVEGMDLQRRRTTSATAPARGGDGDTVRRAGRIVIVGASLTGLRAATTLRREGFTGSLTLIGDEPYEPYDRPPLSKQVLDGWVPAQRTDLPRPGDLDAQWRLGVPATGLDLARRQVLLADGEEVGFDRLLIATGVRARPWPNPAEAALDGVFVLRGRDDAAGLQRRLAAGPRRVLIIGAGFIGSEVASACRGLGLAVTVAERGPTPLVGALGRVVGAPELIEAAKTVLANERSTAMLTALHRGYRPARIAAELGVSRKAVSARITPLVIYAFRPLDSDLWVGPYDALDDGYTDGELDFNPANPCLPFAGQRLTVRYGPVSEAVMEPPWHYVYALVDERRIRPTKFVQDALFTP